MFVHLNYVFALACALSSVNADVSLTVYTDNRCNTPSTTATNVSVPLDACIVTIGMGSVKVPTIPCSGGAPSVQQYGFTDSTCTNYGGDYYYGGGCHGTLALGEAIGSILVTCKAAPTSGGATQPDGTTVTLNVGPVANGGPAASGSSVASSPAQTSAAASPGGGSSGTGSAAPGGSDSSSSSSSSCNGWSCLTNGERIGIIVALAVGIPPILIGLWALWYKKKKNPNKDIFAMHDLRW